MRRAGSIGVIGATSLLALLWTCSCRPAPVAEPQTEPAEPLASVTTPAPPSARSIPNPEPEPSSTLQPDAASGSDPAQALLDHPPPEPEPPPELWPDDLPWISDAALRHASVEISPAGDVRLEQSTDSADLSTTIPRLLQALLDAGYTESTPCELEDDGRGSCLLQLADRLTLLSAHPSYPGSDHATVVLHLYPAGHRPRQRLPGRCTTPPTRERMILVHAVGFDQEGNYRQAESRHQVTTHPGADLDGDGIPETYVPHASKGACPWEVPHDVYVMRGACGHRVGTIVGPVDRSTAIAPFTKGLRAVTTTAEWAAYDGDFPEPNHHTRTRRYEFDGRTLLERADDDREGICHHCGAVSCRQP